jgi:hypothetical protein
LKVNDKNIRVRILDPDPLVRGMDPRIRIPDQYPDFFTYPGIPGSRVLKDTRSQDPDPQHYSYILFDSVLQL